MALGGGNFITQNKILPGSYINFVSTAVAGDTLSQRGYATMALELDWGMSEVLELTADDFSRNSLEIFGYEADDENLTSLVELFKNASTLYIYRLNGGGVKASCDFATAKYAGTRGNDLKIVIAANVDETSYFDVSTYLDYELMETQTVESSADLVDNDYVDFVKTVTLATTAGTALTGGTNAEVTTSSHQAYLDKMESYTFNAMGAFTTDDTIKALYASFVKRMREEVGLKFQLVLYDYDADYEAVVSVANSCSESTANLVYWVTGAIAACEVNKSCTNKLYDGVYTVDTAYTQSQLEDCILGGKFAFHKVGSEVRVLSDINTLLTTSDSKGDIFKENQTIRVIDQIATDVATLFNTKYLGVVPNDAAGRISLWADIVKIHEALAEIRAIEDFSDTDVAVGVGESKKSVIVSDVVTVVNAMAQLYMTVTVY